MKERVGFGPRLGATLLDVLIMAVVGIIVYVSGISIALMQIAVFLYTLIEATTGASPGKRILGLQIGTSQGEIAPLPVLLTRYAVKYSGTILNNLAAISSVALLATIGQIASLIVFLGCFLVLTASRQAMHDMAAKTAVYRRNELLGTV